MLSEGLSVSEHAPLDWYLNFFTELPNEFWRHLTPAELTGAEVEFVERHLGLVPGARILDVPCGSGRHALAFARRGYHVSGVDISPEAIAHARRAAADAGLSVELSVADMRHIQGDGRFDAAVCMGNSFGYVDVAGTRDFAGTLVRAVRPGGGLVVDFGCTAESVLPNLDPGPTTLEAGGVTMVATSHYDVVASRLVTNYRFSRGADVVQASALHYVYTSAQLGSLLTDVGFTDIERYGGVDDKPYAVGDRRLLLIARRRPR
jgi:SAM-dependent methyltransferase